MIKKRIFSLIISICILGCVFLSCSTNEYSDALTCKELSTALMREISVPDGEFSQYAEEDINFLFPTASLYSDVSIMYSKDATDITELGVLHAENQNNSKQLFEEAKEYIKNLQEQKREFIQNYSPEEMKKLNSAEARCFGNYVIFVVSDVNDKSNIFAKADQLLKK